MSFGCRVNHRQFFINRKLGVGRGKAAQPPSQHHFPMITKIFVRYGRGTKISYRFPSFSHSFTDRSSGTTQQYLRRERQGRLVIQVEAEDDEGADANEYERHEDHEQPHFLVAAEGQQPLLQEGHRLVHESRQD